MDVNNYTGAGAGGPKWPNAVTIFLEDLNCYYPERQKFVF